MPHPITIITASQTQTFQSPTTPKSGIWEGNGGRLFLSSPRESPISGKHDNKNIPKGFSSPPASPVKSDLHAFRPPGPTDSRCPCPALNTLANHGYLPRDGKNITISTFMSALQNSGTYNLSEELARVLAEGGEVLIGESIFSKILPLFKHNIPISLHDLALHNGVEHDASIVHRNAAKGQKFAPIRTDIRLLDDFLGDRSDIDLADIAHRRVALERVTPLDLEHAEIARGEWALVLGIFGHAHGGKIPVEALRVWLGENRFPNDWCPTHKLNLEDTVKTSYKLHEAMNDLKKNQPTGWTADDERNKRMLVAEPEEIEVEA